MPDDYVIYDARVAYSLNWLIFAHDLDLAFFPQPVSLTRSRRSLSADNFQPDGLHPRLCAEASGLPCAVQLDQGAGEPSDTPCAL